MIAAMRFRVGVQMASLSLPLTAALSAAARTGAVGLELEARGPLAPRELSQTARRQLRKMFQDRGLAVSCLAFPTRRGYSDEQELDRRVAATKQALTLAYELGTQVVVNGIGEIPSETTDPRQNQFLSALLDLGRHGQRCGAILAARTGHEKGQVLADLMAQLPDGTLGIDFDPAALIMGGHSPAEALACLAPWIVHVHARDAIGDRATGRGQETRLGRGDADFVAIAAALDQRGFRGFFTIQRDVARQAPGEIADAVQFLKALQQPA